MKLYKLFRIKGGKLYPLYVDDNNQIILGESLMAKELPPTADGKISTKKLGKLAYRPGWHLTEFPFADHIGTKQPDGTLYQSKDTVWCEVSISGHDYTEELAHRPESFVYEGMRLKPIGNILGGVKNMSKYMTFIDFARCNWEEFNSQAKLEHVNFDVFETEDGRWVMPTEDKLMVMFRSGLETSKCLKTVDRYEFPLRERCMKHLPTNGYYWFSTNPSAKCRWLIAEEMVVIRQLSNEEVAAICRAHGIEPQPLDK